MDVDLYLDLPGAGARLRERLEHALRQAIIKRRLTPGQPLPSSRALAADLGIARGTVVDAYSQLVAEGWLVARHGSGTRVAPEIHERSVGKPAVTGAGPRRPVLFRPGTPDLSAFPRTLWQRALREVLRSAPSDALGYGDPRGPATARGAIAAYLGRTRGVLTSADQVVITVGLAQALSLTATVLHARGHKMIGMEDPGPDGFLPLVQRTGLHPVGVSVDEEGLDVHELARSGASGVVVTPAHQFPLGVVLTGAQRQALGSWVRGGGGGRVIIEDDYDAEFRYDREPVGALQALAPDHVVTAGSVSKTLAPGLRIGWAVAPAHLIEELAAAKDQTVHGTPTLDALALAHLIDTGAYDRHLRAMRRLYRRRRDTLLEVLARYEWARPAGVAAGLHVTVYLPDDLPAGQLAATAAEHNLELTPLSRYAVNREPPNGVVIGYGALTATTEREAFARLDRVLTIARSQVEGPGHDGG